MVAHKLYQSLSAAARQHLHYFWYVAKDQTRPLVQAAKKRSCHIKLSTLPPPSPDAPETQKPQD